MKVAITGHTTGIGWAIAALYPNSVGFSRSNGYDISKPDNIVRIIAESADCDVFINNAWYEFSQCYLLDGIFKIWKDNPDKTIVNINSSARYVLTHRASPYGKSKMELYNKAKSMMFSKKRCRIININPGSVKTNMNRELHKKINMLTPEQLAKMIKWCIDQPQGVEIGELSVWYTTDKFL